LEQQRLGTVQDVKQYSEALAAYDVALQLRPDFPEAWNNKGCVLDRMKRYKEALWCFERAIQLQPEFQVAIQNRELMLSQLRQTDTT
jgi:tetratricopeptide (TPR) repeat protein